MRKPTIVVADRRTLAAAAAEMKSIAGLERPVGDVLGFPVVVSAAVPKSEVWIVTDHQVARIPFTTEP